MMFKRWRAAAMLLILCSALGSCSGFSGYVADHWPHWAGGMPDDVPPRPGAPGYADFIAHGQADQEAAKPGSAGGKPPIGEPQFATRPPLQPAATAPAPLSADGPPEGPSIVKGGLY
jgi:hypothetical protein